MAHRRPERLYGTRQNRQSFQEVLDNLHKVHTKLLQFLEEADPTQFADGTPFFVRLSMDTSEHYPEHTLAICAWRARKGL